MTNKGRAWLVTCTHPGPCPLLPHAEIRRRLNARQVVLGVSVGNLVEVGSHRTEPISAGWKLSVGCMKMLRAGTLPREVYYQQQDASGQILTKQVGVTNWQSFRSLLLDSTIIFLQARKEVAQVEAEIRRFDVSANGLWLARQLFPGIDGNGIRLAIKEEQFDTSDIDLLGRSFRTELADPDQDDHATIMASIAGGAGNSSLQGLGVAPALLFTGTTFDRLLPEPDSWYRQHGISIQNHSYGVGVESEYGADAAAYDASTWQNTTLLHVFSAGNAGFQSATSGVYSGLPRWANLTGSFKMSKNALVVAATDSFNMPESRSSRGPAHDGRIKPDLGAFGEDGTSGAAAYVSGAAALLQQLLRNNTGQLPDAALLKSILLASSDDVKNAGPDFVTGFGLLQLPQALQVAAAGQYYNGQLGSGEWLRLPLKIPQGLSRIAVQLTWTDTAGAAGTFRALERDLDVVIVSPNGDTIYPWILQTNPDSTALAAPATRGRDSLNNTEQISMFNPVAGDYQLMVYAGQWKGMAQSFSLAWHFDTARQLRFLNPVAQRSVTLREGTLVRWQHSWPAGTIGRLYLENLRDGRSELLNEAVNLDSCFFNWSPAGPGGYTARLIMEINQQQFVSDSFLVIDKPTVKMELACADSLLLRWSPVAGASVYRVYNLRGNRMEPIVETTDTSALIQTIALQSDYLAVDARTATSAGLRSTAFDIRLQAAGCYIQNFFAGYNPPEAVLSARIGSLYQVESVRFEKETRNGFITINNYEQPLSKEFVSSDDDLQSGGNSYRLVVQLSNGATIASPIRTVYHFTSQPLLLFPNPVAVNSMPLLLSNYPEELRVEIMDMQGRNLRRQQINSFQTRVNTTGLPAGMYILRIFDLKGGLIQQTKMLIQ